MTGSDGEGAVGMRLNQVADPGGGGPAGGGRPNLASSPAQKTNAANTLHNDIEPATRTAGAWADDETGAVVKAFDAKDGHGWLTSGAVGTMHTTWGEQVQHLMNQLSGDESALRANNTFLTGTDFGVGDTTRKVSVFDGYSLPPGQ
ncbi:hypothetical protein ABZX95_18630 [Streptomyces sp. NPDC004232]|uniref:hypothetical protein n=2 Tax=Streptomyces TaxID=1883 RepID=UPI0033ABE5B2